MAALTAAQHDQLRRWIENVLPKGGSKQDDIELRTTLDTPNPLRNSALLAFAGLGLLNVPAFAFFEALKLIASQALLKKVAESRRNLRTELSTVLRTQEAAWQIASQEEFSQTAHWWISRLGVSVVGLRQGYYWSIISASFLHVEFSHWVNTLLGIFEIAGPCSQVPGMNAWHVGVVTLGSGVVTNLLGLLQHSNPFPCIGASGVISAFWAIGALGSPWEKVAFRAVNNIAISIPMWLSGVEYTFRNCIALCNVLGLAGSPGLVSPRTGYLSHLSGVALGALYYSLVLSAPAQKYDQDALNRPPSSNKGTPRTEYEERHTTTISSSGLDGGVQ
ncbi:hypothetical protein TI39_contig610g00010 [Zymoseptoria brevis]|uniref:rhomboid protease n=1 Tax=Zymoseptoria brevis TaxID=1047168 RepID=A0A0F4GKD1_9PEZI|nr:hypothetical protein TI39_contig610g00010 [Zymoseptoria brevis]